MKTDLAKSILTLLGGAFMVYLFLEEQMGVNTLIFSVVTLAILLWQAPDLTREPGLWAVGGGTLLTALLVVWHNSILTKTVHLLSFTLLIGLVQQRTLRFLWYGFLLGLISLFSSPINMIWSIGKKLRGDWKNFFRWGQLIILPLIIGSFFFLLYYAAVPSFSRLTDRLGAWVDGLFFWKAPGEDFWLFVFGMMVAASLLWKSILAIFAAKRDRQFGMKVVRKKPSWFRIPFSTMGLKKEYLVALIAVNVLNGLLLIVNLSQWAVFFRQWSNLEANQHSQSLHATTELLIFSIILAMGVLLFFFRRNLNFFPNNKILKFSAYLWLIQNGLLALTALFQDVQYVLAFGMAYYRLWLGFFLLLVIVGLISVYVKIEQKKSIYYLFVTNAWGLYLSFLLISCVNWDVLITRFNIFHAQNEQIDLYFLFHHVSDKNTFLLEKHKDFILEQKHPYYITTEKEFDETIRKRRLRLEDKWKTKSWKSWNYSYERNRRAIKFFRK